MDVPVLIDQQELIDMSSVRTQDVVWETCREQWMIETDGERIECQETPRSQHDLMMMLMIMMISPAER